MKFCVSAFRCWATPLRPKTPGRRSSSRLTRTSARFQGRGNLRGWLFGIARHRCLDAAKSSRRHSQRYPLDAQAGKNQPDDRPDADGQLDQPRRSAVLRQCLQALDTGVRVAVLLRYEEGLAYEEIARMSRELAATIQARVARALPRLRECLESKGVGL